jgi:cyclophilin family peptidyl-prolyl cis-trans isomerase
MGGIFGKASAPPSATNSDNPIATFDTTMGTIKAEIYLDRVPRTASNFIDLAQSGFYNGVHFHRVIPGFMNQFGCPNAKDPKSRRAGTGGPPDGSFKNLKTGATEKRFNGGNIMDENISKDTNAPGTLSMANTGQANTGGSQFFMNVANNANLDWFSPGSSKHPVFGKITEGYDLANKISKVPTQNDNPVTPIMMKSISISNLGATTS